LLATQTYGSKNYGRYRNLLIMIQGYYISCIVGITHIHEKFLYLLNQAKRRKIMSVLKMKKKTEHK